LQYTIDTTIYLVLQIPLSLQVVSCKANCDCQAHRQPPRRDNQRCSWSLPAAGAIFPFLGHFAELFPPLFMTVCSSCSTTTTHFLKNGWKKKRKNGEIYCVTHTHEKSANAMTIRLDKDMNDKYVESRKKKEKLRCTDAPEHNR
jgi:hypothetical protein